MATEPKQTHLEAITVAGIVTRTNNAFETDPKLARIPGLWQRFANENLTERLADTRLDHDIVAVYYDYDTSQECAYTLLVGVAVSAETTLPDIDLRMPSGLRLAELENGVATLHSKAAIVTIATEPGDYLVFEARGQMPQALIQCWRDIWTYFAASKAKRAFQTDLEFHRNDGVDVHVGIKC